MARHIAQRLVKARRSRNISQKKLGIALGLSDKTISAYESGRILPPLGVLFKIEDILRVKAEYLIGDDEAKFVKSLSVSNIEKMLGSIQEELKEIKSSQSSK